MEKNFIFNIAVLIVTISLTSCSSMSSTTSTAALPAATSANNYAVWSGNTATIWDQLQHTSSPRLMAMQNKENDPVKIAWLQLAIISKQHSTNTQELAQELLHWRAQYPSHPGNQLIPANATLNALITSPAPHQIAVLLPQNGTFSSAAQSVREGFLNSYYANLPKAGKQSIKFYDTTTAQNITGLYQQAVAEGADVVIGPLVKTNVQQLSNTATFTAPTLALNYTDNRYRSLPANFYEFGLLPEDEAGQIAERAHKAGLVRAIIIAPQDNWGKRLTSAFTTKWKAIGGNVQETYYFTKQSDYNKDIAHLLNVNLDADKKLMKDANNKTQLEQQRRHDFDVIFLFAQPQHARVIVPLLRYYYASDIPIYATSAVYSGKPNPEKDVDLNGVIVCDIPWNTRVAQLASGEQTQSDRLYAVGQDAYLLSQNMQRLNQLANFPIYGTTGALSATASRQIHRRLPCISIRNGLL